MSIDPCWEIVVGRSFGGGHGMFLKVKEGNASFAAAVSSSLKVEVAENSSLCFLYGTLSKAVLSLLWIILSKIMCLCIFLKKLKVGKNISCIRAKPFPFSKVVRILTRNFTTFSQICSRSTLIHKVKTCWQTFFPPLQCLGQHFRTYKTKMTIIIIIISLHVATQVIIRPVLLCLTFSKMTDPKSIMSTLTTTRRKH